MQTLAELVSLFPLRQLLAEVRLDILVHLLGALVAGGAIGMERSFHGRPAGFRTHALVCLASSLLMLLTVYQAEWFRSAGDEVRIDPTRMAQGIMTGIGFLGAGVIFREGLSVRGLTTAASIWTTAAVGVLMGVGMYLAGALATILVLGVLSVFRQIEMRFPTEQYAHHVLRFARDAVMPEREVRAFLAENGFKVSSFAYELSPDPALFEYRMTIRTVSASKFTQLAEALGRLPAVRGFLISPTTE
jgi:putative Mg2+ transporter-C (MgtC) family protein